jgi:Vacuolar sorting protein 39 domain 2
LVLLTGDGSLRLVHSDTLESRVALKGPILAAAVTLPTTSLPRIAVATRVTISRALRVSVYDILPAGGQVPSLKLAWEVDVGASGAGGAVCLAWAGESVILGAGMKYFITWTQRNSTRSGSSSSAVGAWRDLLAIEEDTGNKGSTGREEEPSKVAKISPLVSAVTLPRQGCAFISVGSLGLVVSPAGEPRGNPILLQDIPAVRAVASGEGVLAVVCEDGIRIADPVTGKWIQGLGFGENLVPAPGQPLRASGGGGSNSSVVLVAGRHKVWALTPIPLVEQARDMLSRRDFAGALKLAANGLAEGKTWAEEAYAQTAVLLMHEGRFLEALVALEHCSPTAFQPAELFPLFPQYTEPWETHLSPLHWSLSGPLEALEKMINKSPLLLRNRKQLRKAAAGGGGGGVSNATTSTSGNGTSDEVVVDEERLKETKQAIVQYLFRARVLPEVWNLDGVDTLLMHLLIDLNAAQEAAAFAAVVPHAIRPEFVAKRLENAGWKHALATLWAATGHAEPALKIWKELSDIPTLTQNNTTDSTTNTNSTDELALRERKEAIQGVTTLLHSKSTCLDISLVLSYIPWLLHVSPSDASHVLSSRDDLKSEDILPLLPLGEETRWRYLEHLVNLETTSSLEETETTETFGGEHSLHTDLAEALIAAIFKAAPGLKEEFKSDNSNSDDGRDGSQQQRNAVVARHRSVLPMVLPQPIHNNNTTNTNITTTTSTPLPPPLSVAALVSGMRPPNPEDAADPIESLRYRLRSHIETSTKINYSKILSTLKNSSLLEEEAVVHWRRGDHKAVLRVLAVALRDVNAAVCYASVYLPPEDHRMLLHLLLNPEEQEGSNDDDSSSTRQSSSIGNRQEPRWEDACRVVALLGSTLDSLEVVRAAPEGMPMPAAVALMAPLLRERVHRRRQGQLTAALRRSQAAAGAMSLASVEEQHVVVDEGRACPDCHLRLGGKVFVVVQQQHEEGGRKGGGKLPKQQQRQAPQPKSFCLSCWNKRQKLSNA